MKSIFFLVLSIGFATATFAQEIEIDALYASSSSKKFNNCFGYKLGYNQFVKSKNRFGILLSQYFFKTDYDDIRFRDGRSKYIVEIEPNNQRIALKINYAFRLIDNPKSKLYLGPEMGINYFRIREQHYRTANGDINEGSFNSDYSLNNKISIGFLFEFELNEFIHKRISTFLSVHPEIIGFEEFPAMGSSDPWFVGWLNFNFGIRYSLNNRYDESQ